MSSAPKALAPRSQEAKQSRSTNDDRPGKSESSPSHVAKSPAQKTKAHQHRLRVDKSSSLLTTEATKVDDVPIENTIHERVLNHVDKRIELAVETDGFLNVSEVNAPPRPKREDACLVQYPSRAKFLEIQGVVLLGLKIDQAGVVRQAEVLRGLGYGLDSAARQAMLQCSFWPARHRGNAVGVRDYLYEYAFVLDTP